MDMTSIDRPVFEPTDPSGEVVQAVRDHGCALVHGLLTAETCKELRDRADEAYARMDELHLQGALSAEYVENMHRYAHVAPSCLDRRGEPEHTLLRALFDSPLPHLYGAAFGPRFYLTLNNTLLRRQVPGLPAPQVPFHQDASFLGAETDVLNAWIPLDPCGPGTGAPSLEVVLTEDRGLLDHGRPSDSELFEAIALSPRMLDERFGPAARWRPRFRPGDALLMTERTIHRTYVEAGMSRVRTSIESRAIPDGPLPAMHAGALSIEVQSARCTA